MIFSAPHILPPERPAIIRANDLRGLPSWQEMQRRQKATFPFPLVPRGPTLGNDNYTKILLHFDGTNGGTTFTDSNAGGSAHTWTATSATTSTTSPKFGTAKGSFATGFIDTPDSADFTLGSGDFTLDFQLAMTGSTDGVLYRILGQCDSSATATTLSLGVNRLTGNTVSVTANVGASSFTVTSTSTFLAADAFKHIAMVRNGANLMLFVNGTQEGGTAAIAGTVNDSANKFTVGRLGELTTNALLGTIDELRLSVGIARWTAAFTPPNIAYF